MTNDAQPSAAAPAKPAVQSRTIWFNGVCLALAAAEPLLPGLRAVLPGGLFTVLAFVVPVGNAVLRGLTTCPLRLPGQRATEEPSQ